MAVEHTGAVFRRGAGDGPAKSRAKAILSPKRRHPDVVSLKALAPRAGLVQAAHRHRKLGAEPVDQIDDETLGAPWSQAEHHLHHARRTGSRCAHEYLRRHSSNVASTRFVKDNSRAVNELRGGRAGRLEDVPRRGDKRLPARGRGWRRLPSRNTLASWSGVTFAQ